MLGARHVRVPAPCRQQLQRAPPRPALSVRSHTPPINPRPIAAPRLLPVPGRLHFSTATRAFESIYHEGVFTQQAHRLAAAAVASGRLFFADGKGSKKDSKANKDDKKSDNDRKGNEKGGKDGERFAVMISLHQYLSLFQSSRVRAISIVDRNIGATSVLCDGVLAWRQECR